MENLTYLESHPWLTFELNLKKLDFEIWQLLGEARSKCEHIAGAPLLPEVAAQMHTVALSRGIHGTTSIEGNTLSESQVEARIRGGLELPKSQEYLGKEIDNVLAVANDIAADVVAGKDVQLSVDGILGYNGRLLEGLPLKDEVVPGELRQHSVTVGISYYRGAPAKELRELLEKLVTWLNGMQAPESNPELVFPIAILKAIMAHLYIAWIHPFGDGNGRTARMIELQLLTRAGLPTPAAHLLSNHYNLTRDVYLTELDKTSRQEGHPIEGFIKYALEGFVDQLREQIDYIRAHQHMVLWEKLVHDRFKNEETPAKRRQRHLILDMPHHPVARNALREVSTRVAREFGNSSSKTLTRDINELMKKGLLKKTPEGYVANHAITAAFLPARLESEINGTSS